MDNIIEKKIVPLLAECINSSEGDLALESLKAAKALVYYSPLGDLTEVLNSALQHKSKDVAYFSLDVMRQIHEAENQVKSLNPVEYKKILIDAVIPFLVTCFKSSSENIVLDAMNATAALSSDAEIKDILFDPVEQMMVHKNKQIAYLALDIIRSMNAGREIHVFERT